MKVLFLSVVAFSILSACGSNGKKQKALTPSGDPLNEMAGGVVKDLATQGALPTEGDSKSLTYTILQRQVHSTAFEPLSFPTTNCVYEIAETQTVVPNDDLRHPFGTAIRVQKTATKTSSSPANCSAEPKNFKPDEVNVFSGNEYTDHVIRSIKGILNLDDLNETGKHSLKGRPKRTNNVKWNKENIKTIQLQISALDPDKHEVAKEVHIHKNQLFLGILQVNVGDLQLERRRNLNIRISRFYVQKPEAISYP